MKQPITLTFLAAKYSFAKTFGRKGKQIHVDPRPPKYVTSSTVQIHKPSDFKRAIERAAKTDKCLLKGDLSRELKNESRAGHTLTAAPTRWICFDIDGTKSIKNAEDFIKNVLPSEFQEVSYVEQISASSKMTPTSGYRSHLFFLLDKPLPVDTLKHWLLQLNLENPLLKKELELTATGLGLKYKLDITLADNSHLIYITEPILTEGVKNPHPGKRIRSILKRLSVIPNFEKTRRALSTVAKLRRSVIITLRKAAKLQGKVPRIDTRGDMDYQRLAPGHGSYVCDYDDTNPTFGYVNLYNIVKKCKGDSRGYWFFKKDPEFLHNFKGEPTLYLNEVDPEFFKKVAKPGVPPAPEPRVETSSDALDCFAGMDIHRRGKYFVGTWNETKQYFEHELYRVDALKAVKDWLAIRGVQPYSAYPDYTVSCNPAVPACFDKEQRIVNYNYLSPHLIRPKKSKRKNPPKTIHLIHTHALGDDKEMVDYFYNRMAYIAQFCELTGKAILLSGTQGTGKGLLYNRIYSPLFGNHAQRFSGLTSLENHFNSQMEGTILVYIDEVDKAAQKHGEATIMQNLKQAITDDQITIHRKFVDPYKSTNRCNWMLASNRDDPFFLEQTDRRFIIAPRQEESIAPRLLRELGLEDGLPLELAIVAELKEYGSWLMSRKVDKYYARSMLDTEERQRLMARQLDASQVLTTAIKTGDLSRVLEIIIDETANNRALGQMNSNGAKPEIFGLQCIRYALTDEAMNIPRDDLHNIYNLVMSRLIPSATVFGEYLKNKHGLDIKPVHIKGKRGMSSRRGLRGVTWRLEDASAASRFQKWAYEDRGIDTNVIDFEKHRKKSRRKP